MVKPHEAITAHIPSFFKNSFPGNHACTKPKREHATDDTGEVATDGPSAGSPLMKSDEEVYEGKRPASVGGFSCCVPGCCSNSKRHTNLPFHIIQIGRVKINRP